MNHLAPPKGSPPSVATLCGKSMMYLFAKGETVPSPNRKKTTCPDCAMAKLRKNRPDIAKKLE